MGGLSVCALSAPASSSGLCHHQKASRLGSRWQRGQSCSGSGPTLQLTIKFPLPIHHFIPPPLFLSFFKSFCHYLVMCYPRLSFPLSSCIIKYWHFKLWSVLVFISFHFLSFDHYIMSKPSFGTFVSLPFATAEQLAGDQTVPYKISLFPLFSENRERTLRQVQIFCSCEG